MTGSEGLDRLDRFLSTDPRDVGCEQAMQILHVYVELVHDRTGHDAAQRYPGVAAHLAAWHSGQHVIGS